MIRQKIFFTVAPVTSLIITQLHILRNISNIYLAVYACATLISLWIFIYGWRFLSRIEKNVTLIFILVFLFPLFSLIFGVISDAYGNAQDVFIGISRVMFALPIYMAILCVPADEKLIKNLILVSALFTLIASISIPYQFAFGSIEWFAESSERAGLYRFASLFGSLTALGIVCGFGILAAAVSVASTTFFALLVTGIVTGALLSLQKAAIVNIIFAFIFVPFVRKFSRVQIIVFVCAIGFFFALAWLLYGEMLAAYISSVRLSSDGESSYSGDMSIFESIWDRVSELPGIAIRYHGWFGFLFGLGPVGGSGAFGYPEVPMSHNGIVDIFLIGGVPYFLLFISLAIYIFKNRAEPVIIINSRNLYRFGVIVCFGVILNMVFSGLLVFTPSNAMFLSLAIKCLFLHRKNILN